MAKLKAEGEKYEAHLKARPEFERSSLNRNLREERKRGGRVRKRGID